MEQLHEKNIYQEKKYRLSEFFDTNWDKYCKKPTKPIKPEHYKAVNAIRTCRTAVLGKRVYACPQCGDVSEVTHSCKHRFCPTCSWKDTLKWAEKAYTKLLDIPHRHAVATLPHALNPLLAKNYRQLNNALIKSAAETIKEWMDAKYGVVPGIMSVLHTFGEKKNRHHHVHMIVSMGGKHKKTDKLKTVATKYIPYKFLSKKFSAKFQEKLLELFDAGMLEHSLNNRLELLVLLKKIRRDNWRFHFEQPMDQPEKVIRYIGRYSKRACLSERKITFMQGECIAFRYKDYKQTDASGKPVEKVQQMHYSDFIPMLLQHVPPTGYQVVRYYGLYANSNKTDNTGLKEISENKQACTSPNNPKTCACCHIEKIHIYTVFDRRKRHERTEKFDIQKHPNTMIDMQKIS